MKMSLKASSARKLATLLSAGCLTGVLLYGCSSDDNDVPSLILTSDAPDQVTVAPTLAPVQPNTTTPIRVPNFAQITPPPVSPDLPDRPSIDDLIVARQENTIVLALQGLRVPGGIGDVRVQVLNPAQGIDLTSSELRVVNPSSVSAFQASLLGRGSSFEDRDENGVTNVENRTTSFGNVTINGPFFRGQLLLDPNRPLLYAGNRLLVILTIVDRFGQVLQVQSFEVSASGTGI